MKSVNTKYFNKPECDRLYYNRQILKLLDSDNTISSYLKFWTILYYIEKYPFQRFGQIICNYIYPNYRNENKDEITTQFINRYFNISSDPFYEESEVTYNRIKEIYSERMDKEN